MGNTGNSTIQVYVNSWPVSPRSPYSRWRPCPWWFQGPTPANGSLPSRIAFQAAYIAVWCLSFVNNNKIISINTLPKP